MREVPDDLVEVVTKTKDIFDAFYVVFTDYTGIEERKVDKERRDKDPILFGSFKNSTNVADRFYFLGDWVDEYCDLTLDKLIVEYKDKVGKNPINDIKIPTNSNDLIEMLKSYVIDDNRNAEYKITLSEQNDIIAAPSYTLSNNSNNKKKSFFEKVRSIFNH